MIRNIETRLCFVFKKSFKVWNNFYFSQLNKRIKTYLQLISNDMDFVNRMNYANDFYNKYIS